MSGATSDAGRFWTGTPGAPSIKNAWGTFVNDNAGIIAQLVTGYGAVNIAGLTTYTLTTANWTSDQARPAMIDFTGALAANCTVTIPNVNRFAWVRNSTTGSHSVILTSGGGTRATVPSDGWWHIYWCDGSGNVSLPNVQIDNIKFSNVNATGVITAGSGILVSAGGMTLNGGLNLASGGGSVSGAFTVDTAGTSGNQVVNYSQFAPVGGTNGYTFLPGGILVQWGGMTIVSGGPTTMAWPRPFASAIWNIQLTIANQSSGTPPSVASGTGTNLTTLQAYTNSGVTRDAYFFAIGA